MRQQENNAADSALIGIEPSSLQIEKRLIFHNFLLAKRKSEMSVNSWKKSTNQNCTSTKLAIVSVRTVSFDACFLLLLSCDVRKYFLLICPYFLRKKAELYQCFEIE